MQTHFATHRLTWQGGLYAACPILLASLFGLNLVLPSHWAVSAFYSVAIVAAVPTWDPRFIRETSVATVLLVLWNAVARHEGGANLTALLLNSVLGLLTAWAVLRLSLDIVGASALRARAQPAPLPLAHPDCARQGSLITMCAWTKRVKDGGHWVSIEEFLDRHLHLVVSHGVSDELKASLIAHQDVAVVPKLSREQRSMPPASLKEFMDQPVTERNQDRAIRIALLGLALLAGVAAGFRMAAILHGS